MVNFFWLTVNRSEPYIDAKKFHLRDACLSLCFGQKRSPHYLVHPADRDKVPGVVVLVQVELQVVQYHQLSLRCGVGVGVCQALHHLKFGVELDVFELILPLKLLALK